jgi:hypothetical protein
MTVRSNSNKARPLNVDSLLRPDRLAGAGASTYTPLPTEPYPAWASSDGDDKPTPQPPPPATSPKPYEPLPREPDTKDNKPDQNKIIVPREKK